MGFLSFGDRRPAPAWRGHECGTQDRRRTVASKGRVGEKQSPPHRPCGRPACNKCAIGDLPQLTSAGTLRVTRVGATAKERLSGERPGKKLTLCALPGPVAPAALQAVTPAEGKS